MTTESIGFTAANGTALPAPWISFFTASGSATVSANKAKLTTPTTTSAFSRMYYPRDYGNGTDILCRVTPGQAWSTDAFLDVGFRSIINGLARYYMELHGSAANNATLVRNDGTNSVVQKTFSVTLTGSNAIWVRFRKVGNWTAVKLWDDGTIEPAVWTSTVFDTAPIAAQTTVLAPWFQCANSTTVTAAATHSFDQITIDDLIDDAGSVI